MDARAWVWAVKWKEFERFGFLPMYSCFGTRIWESWSNTPISQFLTLRVEWTRAGREFEKKSRKMKGIRAIWVSLPILSLTILLQTEVQSRREQSAWHGRTLVPLLPGPRRQATALISISLARSVPRSVSCWTAWAALRGVRRNCCQSQKSKDPASPPRRIPQATPLALPRARFRRAHMHPYERGLKARAPSPRNRRRRLHGPRGRPCIEGALARPLTSLARNEPRWSSKCGNPCRLPRTGCGCRSWRILATRRRIRKSAAGCPRRNLHRPRPPLRVAVGSWFSTSSLFSFKMKPMTLPANNFWTELLNRIVDSSLRASKPEHLSFKSKLCATVVRRDRGESKLGPCL